MTVLFWDRARLDNAGMAFNWDRRGQLKAFEGEDVAPANASGHMSRVREMANAQGQTQRRKTKANIQMSPSLNDAGYGSVMVCLKTGCTKIYCTGWSLSPLNQLFRLERTPFSGQTQCLPCAGRNLAFHVASTWSDASTSASSTACMADTWYELGPPCSSSLSQ